MTGGRQQSDRRIQRTKNALSEALIALMVERGWDEINIRDLCQRANVGRSTFYHHFQNKEELLAGSLDDLSAWVNSHSPSATTTPMPFVHALMEHVYEQRTLFRTVIGRRSGYVVQKRFREMVTRLVKESDAIPGPGWKQDATVNYVAGALVEMMAWWVDTGTKQSVDELEAQFFTLTEPILERK